MVKLNGGERELKIAIDRVRKSNMGVRNGHEVRVREKEAEVLSRQTENANNSKEAGIEPLSQKAMAAPQLEGTLPYANETIEASVKAHREPWIFLVGTTGLGNLQIFKNSSS
ncbi:hypothetical protein ACH5RR_029142 [Cinchona calisaya]|uniref:Uncharacterized protein n=1 Tax=Cinchona calisaya TaxID=153742 RepID=A0ABD2YT09_9GENT